MRGPKQQSRLRVTRVQTTAAAAATAAASAALAAAARGGGTDGDGSGDDDGAVVAVDDDASATLAAAPAPPTAREAIIPVRSPATRAQTLLASTAAAARPAVIDEDDGREIMCAFAVSNLLVGSGRTHTLTILRSDLRRLEDGEYLNDALVDFGVW